MPATTYQYPSSQMASPPQFGLHVKTDLVRIWSELRITWAILMIEIDCLAIDKKEYRLRRRMAKLSTFLSNCCLDHEANREIESALARISSLASGPGCCRSLLSTRGSTGSRSHRRTLHCPNMRKDHWMCKCQGRWPLGLITLIRIDEA